MEGEEAKREREREKGVFVESVGRSRVVFFINVADRMVRSRGVFNANGWKAIMVPGVRPEIRPRRSRMYHSEENIRALINFN